MHPSPRLKAYINHGHELVEGWLSPGAIRAIARLSECQSDLGLSGSVAEIGVHHGRLFILLYLLTAPGERAVAIDLFSHQELNVDRSGAGNLQAFTKNLKRHAGLDRLLVHEGDSTALTSQALIDLGSGPFRLISIDGGHTAEITHNDLALSEAALVRGGIVILDDCFNEMWPGVMTGVSRFYNGPRTIVPFGICSGKTFFCHSDFSEKYQRVLRALDAHAVSHEFLGHPVVCSSFEPWTVRRWLRKVDAFRLFRNLYHKALAGPNQKEQRPSGT